MNNRNVVFLVVVIVLIEFFYFFGLHLYSDESSCEYEIFADPRNPRKIFNDMEREPPPEVDEFFIIDESIPKPKMVIETGRFLKASSEGKCARFFQATPRDRSRNRVEFSYDEVKNVVGPKLLLCGEMKNEFGYVLEWIEFHRIQGFHSIVLYDDNSKDDPERIRKMYRERELGYFKWYGPIFMEESIEGRRNKRMEHCIRNHGSGHDWVVFLTTREFVYSPTYYSVKQWFASNQKEFATVNRIRVRDLRFGFDDVFVEPVNNAISCHSGKTCFDRDFHLVTEFLRRRQPAEYLGEPEEDFRYCFEELCERGIGIYEKLENPCHIGTGRLFIRVSSYDSEISYSEDIVEGMEYDVSNYGGLKLHNYMARSFETYVNKADWMEEEGIINRDEVIHMVRVSAWGNSFRSYVYDDSMETYKGALLSRIRKFLA